MLNSYVARSRQKDIFVEARPVIWSGENQVDVKAGSEMRKQEKEIYTHIKVNIPTYYLDLIDHFEIWAVPSSTGKPELLTRFLPVNQTIEYLDFETPALATNKIRYQVRGLDYLMKTFVKSRPVEVDLEGVLSVTK